MGTLPTRHINAAGLKIVKDCESWRGEVYLCPAGHPTIGWGHRVREDEEFSFAITMDVGEQLLREDLAEAEAGVERLVTVPLTDNQFSALVSWTFNLGMGHLAGSTLLRLLNVGDYQGAADQFSVWVKANGKRLPGLVKRRAQERELFES
jgi:lysozyme